MIWFWRIVWKLRLISDWTFRLKIIQWMEREVKQSRDKAQEAALKALRNRK